MAGIIKKASADAETPGSLAPGHSVGKAVSLPTAIPPFHRHSDPYTVIPACAGIQYPYPSLLSMPSAPILSILSIGVKNSPPANDTNPLQTRTAVL